MEGVSVSSRRKGWLPFAALVAAAALGIGMGAALWDPVDPSGGALGRMLDRPRTTSCPDAVENAYDDFVAACRSRDASRMWTGFSPRLRSEIDARAQEAVASLSRERLAADFGFEGHVGGFDGTAYLNGLLRRGDATSPCQDVDLWRRVDLGLDGDAWIVVVERPGGGRQGMRFTAATPSDRWWLDDLSRVHEPLDGASAAS